jgi:predicted RNase H-like HicB family nuclease
VKTFISMRIYTFKVIVAAYEDGEGNPAWHAYWRALANVGGASSGLTGEEALKNINDVVPMIVEEFIEEGTLSS